MNLKRERVKYCLLPRENKIHIFKPPCNILYLLYHHTAPLMHFYTKSIGDLLCVGLDGLMQASPEKAARPRTHHPFI